MDDILKSARARRAGELVQEYGVRLVHELLTDAGESADAFMANALAEKLGISNGSIASPPSPGVAATTA
jgi:hypothetical protein